LRILVTNDDGIESPGIWALAEAMSRVGETLIVAPDQQQSGVGSSISLHSGMSITQVPSPVPGVSAYAVAGTPTDCVILGLRRLAQGHVDLVVSGINLGANVGNDILCSGTVMATLQGYFRQIPSMALSLAMESEREEPCFDVVARIAESLALGISNGSLPTAAILNVNVPNIPHEKIQGIVITRTASRGYVQLAAVRRGSDMTYDKGVRRSAKLKIEEGTDIWAITSGLISITPLRFDVTDHSLTPTLAEHIVTLESDLTPRAGDGTG